MRQNEYSLYYIHKSWKKTDASRQRQLLHYTVISDPCHSYSYFCYKHQTITYPTLPFSDPCHSYFCWGPPTQTAPF